MEFGKVYKLGMTVPRRYSLPWRNVIPTKEGADRLGDWTIFRGIISYSYVTILQIPGNFLYELNEMTIPGRC